MTEISKVFPWTRREAACIETMDWTWMRVNSCYHIKLSCHYLPLVLELGCWGSWRLRLIPQPPLPGGLAVPGQPGDGRVLGLLPVGHFWSVQNTSSPSLSQITELISERWLTGFLSRNARSLIKYQAGVEIFLCKLILKLNIFCSITTVIFWTKRCNVNERVCFQDASDYKEH